MTTRPWIRLPLAPFLDWARRAGVAQSVRGLARVLANRDPLDRPHARSIERSLQRWKADRGRIPLPAALALCDELGVHPVEIWGDAYIALPEDPRDVIAWHCNRIRIDLADRQAHRTARTRPHATSAPRSIP